ncbi:hypothetical protein TWF281_007654 [Arthrobotrys megalospora]
MKKMTKHPPSVASAAFSWAYMLPIIISSTLFLHSTPTNAFAYATRAGGPRSKLLSGISEDYDCRTRRELVPGVKPLAQFGIVNWKDSLQGRAFAFYDSYVCAEHNLIAIVRLLDVLSGVQYADLSGPNFPDIVRGYRAIDLSLSEEDGGRVIEEAKRMIPGSIYVPIVPDDPTKSSYCTGSIVVTPWSDQYDVSSDDPEKWDEYKKALEALRKTFQEVKRNPAIMQSILGIGSVELPPLRKLDDIRNERIEQFYREKYSSEGPGSGQLERCLIMSAGQKVPEMKDFIVDPSMRPPSRTADNFMDTMTDPDPSKKLKNLAMGGIRNPNIRLDTVNNFGQHYEMQSQLYSQLFGNQKPSEALALFQQRSASHLFPFKFRIQPKEYKPLGRVMQGPRARPKGQRRGRPRMYAQPDVDPRSRAPSQLKDKNCPSTNTVGNSRSQGKKGSGFTQDQKDELQQMIGRYSRGCRTTRIPEFVPTEPEKGPKSREQSEPQAEFNTASLDEEIVGNFEAWPPGKFGKATEEQLNQSPIWENFLDFEFDEPQQRFPMAPPDSLTEERQRNEEIRSMQQMMNNDFGTEFLQPIAANNNLLNTEITEEDKATHEAFMKFLAQIDDKDGG